MSEDTAEFDEIIADRVIRFHKKLLQDPLYEDPENRPLLDALVIRYLEMIHIRSLAMMAQAPQEDVH